VIISSNAVFITVYTTHNIYLLLQHVSTQEGILKLVVIYNVMYPLKHSKLVYTLPVLCVVVSRDVGRAKDW
jgi:hypothetical protein